MAIKNHTKLTKEQTESLKEAKPQHKLGDIVHALDTSYSGIKVFSGEVRGMQIQMCYQQLDPNDVDTAWVDRIMSCIIYFIFDPKTSEVKKIDSKKVFKTRVELYEKITWELDEHNAFPKEQETIDDDLC